MMFTWGPQQLHLHSFQNSCSSPGSSWSSQHPTCWAPPWCRGCWTEWESIQHQEHTPLLHPELQEHLRYSCSLQPILCLHLARDLIRFILFLTNWLKLIVTYYDKNILPEKWKWTLSNFFFSALKYWTKSLRLLRTFSELLKDSFLYFLRTSVNSFLSTVTPSSFGSLL